MTVAALLAGCASAPGLDLGSGESSAPVVSPGRSVAASVESRARAHPTAAPSPSPSTDQIACVAALPEDVRIGQTMLVTAGGVDRVRDWLDQGLIAGVLANGRLTSISAAEFRAATLDTRYGALLAADEEGGGVQRYQDVAGLLPSPQRQEWSMTPDQVRDLYQMHGETLREWGVTLALAPVVDVGHGPAIGSRSYSDDPEVVAEYGAAAAEGLAEAGVLPVLKHFPGQGRTSGDPHYGQAIGPDIASLRAVDLVPYREIPTQVEVGVMVGHTTVPGFSDQPSSQSADTISGLLGDELGFDGLIVSDALGMAGSGLSQGDALVGFLAAGGHLGIVGPGGSIEGRRAVRSALADGTLTAAQVDGAAARVLAVKRVDPCAVVGADAPKVVDSEVPSDEPVVNPTLVS